MHILLGRAAGHVRYADDDRNQCEFRLHRLVTHAQSVANVFAVPPMLLS